MASPTTQKNVYIDARNGENATITTHRVRDFFVRPLAVAVGSACIAVVAAAQQPAPSPADRAALERQAENNKRPDTPGTGRFAAMKEEVTSLPRHVIYRPKDLAALGRLKLGVVAWDNGGCSEDGASSRFHLLEIASHASPMSRLRSPIFPSGTAVLSPNPMVVPPRRSP
jgi:hypothetical protein